MRTFIFLLPLAALAQPYDLVIKNGHVLDPANGVNGVRDVAVKSNVIARVATNIPAADARRVVDAKGLYVTPGLIDLHFHSFGYSGSIDPDETALPTGTTTIVDAGGPGYRTFADFKQKVVAKAKTRVLASINIAGNGMTGSASEDNVADMIPHKTADVIKANRDIIVGIKVAHFGKPGWDALKRAIEAGRLADVPVMVDDKIFTNTERSSREKLLDVMRPGDMHTHMFNDRQVEVVSRFNGKVQEYATEARRRGVLFDLGHGGGSFLWTVAIPAMKQGFYPDTISTDLHTSSIMIQQSDMPNCISKMMLLGMGFEDAIARSTVSPAKAIRRFPEIGTLGEGKSADIAVLGISEGVFAYKDSWGAKMLGTKRVETAITVRSGAVVYESKYRPTISKAEIYDVLIKHPDNDVAVANGKVARIGKNLPASHARMVIEAAEYSVRAGIRESTKSRPYQAYRRCVTSTNGADTLREGGVADIVIQRNGRCVLTMAAGRVVWDTDGLSANDVTRAGAYSNFK
ncbi:MAG: amidohydrolase/deacetylase family metallohydrolase [Acidobacteria bacterium]|nr:amidohydrolase/deacetylase family metallohydrolase [Acidobacteriota bacterium]